MKFDDFDQVVRIHPGVAESAVIVEGDRVDRRSTNVHVPVSDIRHHDTVMLILTVARLSDRRRLPRPLGGSIVAWLAHVWACWALRSVGSGGLDLEHEWGDGKPGDTEQGHRRSGVDRPESGAEHVEVLHGFIHICGVDV